MTETDKEIQQLWFGVSKELGQDILRFYQELNELGYRTKRSKVIFVELTVYKHHEQLELKTPYSKKIRVYELLKQLKSTMLEHNRRWGYFVVRTEMLRKIDTQYELAILQKDSLKATIYKYWLARLNNEEPRKPECITGISN